MVEPDGPFLPLQPKRRDPDVIRREGDQLLRKANFIIRYGKWMILALRLWPWIRLLLMVMGIALAAFAVYWQGKTLLFGRTMSFEFSGIHAPHYTCEEFEREFLQRFTAQGFTVESFRITRETNLKQFDGEITVSGLPSKSSKYDVLTHLRAIGKSMKDKALPVEQ